jgi:hypothetical protein
VLAPHDRHQCSKRDQIQDEARSNAHRRGSRRLIRDREICPNRRKKNKNDERASSDYSQDASHQLKSL